MRNHTVNRSGSQINPLHHFCELAKNPEMCYNYKCLGEWNTGRFAFQNAVESQSIIVGKAPSMCGHTSRHSPKQRRQAHGGRFVMSAVSICPVCHRYKAITDSGVCEPCSIEKVTHVLVKAKWNRTTIHLTNGKIMPKERWYSIKVQIDSFYEHTSFDKIDEYNLSISEKKETQEANIQDGYIYLLKSENGYYKIGKTIQLDTRIKTIMREYPVYIERVHFFKTSQLTKVESFLHSLFSEFRLQGEWFKLEKSHLDFIMQFDSSTTYSLNDVAKRIK